MIEGIFAIVIIAFAGLGVFTLFNHLIRSNEIREEVAEFKRNIAHVDERLAILQEELESLRFDSRVLNDERIALEAQGECMVDLLERHEASMRAAESRYGR